MLAYLASMGWFGMLLAACCVVVGAWAGWRFWQELMYLADVMEEFE